MAKMHEHEARLERLIEAKQDGAEDLAQAPVARHGPRRRRADRDRARSWSGSRRWSVGYLPEASSRGRPRAVPRGTARGQDRDCRAERGRQDHAPAHDRRRTAAARRRDRLRARACSSATWPSYGPRRSPGATVLDALLESAPVTPGEARGYLARFLFRGDDVVQGSPTAVGRRALPSRARAARRHGRRTCYLLDEPTNHLDVVAREAIETFLLETPATMLVVSHDRRFLDTVCERLWVVDGGAVAPFDGGYKAWRAAVSDGWTVACRARAGGEATSLPRRHAVAQRPGGHRRRPRHRTPRAPRPRMDMPPRWRRRARRARSCRRMPIAASAMRWTPS